MGSWIGSSRGGRRGSRGSRGSGEGGASLTYHRSSPCPERLRQGGACGQKSDELASGNDASLQSVLPKNARIYHEGPSGGGVPRVAVAQIGAWIWAGELAWPGPTAQSGERRLRARRISQVPPSLSLSPSPCLCPGGRVGLLVVFSAPRRAVSSRVPPVMRGGSGGRAPGPVLLTPASVPAGHWLPLRRRMEFDV